jgi:hypothetical protein
MKINWNEAPEATHYDKRKGRVPAFMRKSASGNEWEFRLANGGWMTYGTLTDDQVAKLKKRPAPWTGEGRPPVGTVCEAKMPPRGLEYRGQEWIWRRVEVVKSGMPGAENECLVFDLENSAPAWVDMFRPIRTPEQIAAEEQKTAVDHMVADAIAGLPMTITLMKDIRKSCERMYAAGYRKQVTE